MEITPEIKMYDGKPSTKDLFNKLRKNTFNGLKKLVKLPIKVVRILTEGVLIFIGGMGFIVSATIGGGFFLLLGPLGLLRDSDMDKFVKFLEKVWIQKPSEFFRLFGLFTESSSQHEYKSKEELYWIKQRI